jgi:hypothetical protein
MEATVLFVAVAALISLAVTSMRYGADSREAFISKERELASRGIAWDRPPATQSRRPSAARRLNLRIPRLVVPTKCVSASCGA